jgi:predicted ATP-grasp superfamily ATP-dependent carboligase
MPPRPAATAPPALLFMGDYYGTLASARCLGKLGIPVVLAEWRRLVRTQASRYVTRRVKCPPVADVPRFVAWLTDFGRKNPGHVLFPASDELVWIFAEHKAELEAAGFRLAMPGTETIYRILNKKVLYQACAKVGVAAPRTWYPAGEAEVRAAAAEIPLPVILKPQTQVLLASGAKGALVRPGDDLPSAFLAFAAANTFGDALVKRDPLVVWPMVQEFLEAASQNIYSLAGFVDDTYEHWAMRGATKVLQRPRRLGIGLCFEAAPVDDALARGVIALCRELGYFGVFEVEFVAEKGKPLLIDFNPRPYSQMAFEVARRLPLPELLHAAATGARDIVARRIAEARTWSEPTTTRELRTYSHRLLLGMVIAGQYVSALRVRGREREHWDRWLEDHRAHLTDAVRDGEDPFPAAVDAIEHLTRFARHPRSFVRSLLRDD